MRLHPGGNQGTSTPRLMWLRFFRGKAQPSRGVSSLVPDLCPTPLCRVRRERRSRKEFVLLLLVRNKDCKNLSSINRVCIEKRKIITE